MSSEGKRAWVLAVEVPYVSTLLWSTGASIAASIVLHIAVTMGSPQDAGQKDQRDREIHRFGEYNPL
jgi:hypothetical protein